MPHRRSNLRGDIAGMAKGGPITRVLAAVLVAFLSIFLVLPVAATIGQAFVSNHRPSLEFVQIVLGTPGNVYMLARSLNLAISATVFASIFSLVPALLLRRYTFRGKGLLALMLLLPMILPPFVGAVGIRKLLARFGPVNLILMAIGIREHPFDFIGAGGLTAVALTQALHLFPILYLTVSASLARLDCSLEEAARNAGASPLRCFWRVTLPLIMPGYFAGACLVFIASLTDLGTPLVFNLNDVVAVRIFSLLDEMHTNPMAHALVAVLFGVTLGAFALSKSVLPPPLRDAGSKQGTPSVPKNLHGMSGVLAVLAVLMLCLCALAPHCTVLLLSVTDKWFMSVLPSHFTVSHYADLLRHPLTLGSILNSLGLSLGSTILGIICGTAIGYLIVRSPGAKAHIFDVLSIVPLAVPGVVLAFGYLSWFGGSSLDPRINPMPLLMIGYAIRRLPFSVRSVIAGFQHSSLTLEEAAQNAGASPWHTFWRITWPLLFKHILAAAILCFSFSMLEVSESLMLAMEERFYPITKAMYVLLARPDGLQIASALGVVGMVLVALSLLVAGSLLGRNFGDVLGG